ncbi:MAG: PAS domain S-box protein [Desulfuromonadales bacterium]|nr:PAS domain S-box protein [Desulfuromonadales bacterium]MBN2791728.1 PAS domain S-box protein [Desulfuromonadales bacterium]
MRLLVGKDVSRVQEIIKTLEEENQRHYQNRIEGLVDYVTFPSREGMIRAFAQHDREHLVKLAIPFGKRFKQENHNFSSFGWITTDNTVCTRVLAPDRYGDDISNIRPDIVMANRTEKPVFGYMTAPTGLEYRLVQPVTYAGEHVGVVQLGLSDSMLLDAIHEKMGIAVAMLIPTEKFSAITRSQLPSYSLDQFTVQSHQLDFFKKFGDKIDWQNKDQRLSSDGQEYMLARAIDLNNFKNEPEGFIFVALDITPQLQNMNRSIVFIILMSATLLVLAFFIIYPSYGSLVQKVVTLNESLESSNQTLEVRVQKRTKELIESEKRFKQVLDESPLGILITDRENLSIHYANPAISSQLGYTQTELENMSIEALHRSFDLPKIIQKFNL